ncbi:MAG TPA: bifunctional nuclease domain-containing protein [Streptosporangiaceae bacterium]
MFGAADRDLLMQRLLDLARADPAIAGAAVTGSLASGSGDRWSDIDLALGVSRPVAAALGITRGAVKARLHQGRAALAARLAPLIDRREDQYMTMNGDVQWVDAEVSEIRRTRADDPAERKHIMILTERAGDRSLPTWIGPVEATALALAMASAEAPRPFIYQLAAAMVTHPSKSTPACSR